jgi:hypothetical protein
MSSVHHHEEKKMPNERKVLPKALHTVTVLVRVARALQPANPHASNGGLVRLAIIALGYTDAADPHGLLESALKQMEA